MICLICKDTGKLDDAQAWDCGQENSDCPYCPEQVEETLKDYKRLREGILRLRKYVWLRDVPNPTTPEYIEFHGKMQEILQFINEELLEGGGE